MNNFYCIDNKNNVFKYYENKKYFLKLSPWNINEDRRYAFVENIKKIKKEKALEIINKQFYNVETEWKFNNKTYFIISSDKSNSTFETYLNNKYIFYEIHRNPHSLNEQITIQENFYLTWVNGKIYWLELIGQYYPRVRLYKFNDINKKPHYSDFIKWTHARNCKIIYEK